MAVPRKLRYLLARVRWTVMFVQSCVAHLVDSDRCIICTCWGIILEIDGVYWKHPLDGRTYELVTVPAGSDELCPL